MSVSLVHTSQLGRVRDLIDAVASHDRFHRPNLRHYFSQKTYHTFLRGSMSFTHAQRADGNPLDTRPEKFRQNDLLPPTDSWC